MDSYTFAEKSDVKPMETLLPIIKGQVVNIPHDMQQVTIKDSTIFIGKKHRRHRLVVCVRFTVILALLLLIGMGVFTWQPALYRAVRSIMENEMISFGCKPSINGASKDSMATTPMYNWYRTQVSEKIKQPDYTVLYSMRNPYSSSSDFLQISSVYVARAGQTILSFNFQPNVYTTIYIADISVKSSIGEDLLVNGNFTRGIYGWQGVSYTSSCGYSLYYNNCFSTSYKIGDTLSQTFSTTAGSILYISFKLRWTSGGSDVGMNVTIY